MRPPGGHGWQADTVRWASVGWDGRLKPARRPPRDSAVRQAFGWLRAAARNGPARTLRARGAVRRIFSAVLGSYASGHATAEGRLLMVRHLTRKIPALADRFATLRGFVPRGPIARRHLTPIRSLQRRSRSVIGARSPARSPGSSSPGLEPCLRARSCPVQPETCRIAPSRPSRPSPHRAWCHVRRAAPTAKRGDPAILRRVGTASALVQPMPDDGCSPRKTPRSRTSRRNEGSGWGRSRRRGSRGREPPARRAERPGQRRCVRR